MTKYSNGAKFSFAKIGIQPKLKVSQPGDAYEREADRVAEHVMRMPVSDSAVPTTTVKEEGIDRKCSDCGMEEEQEGEEDMEISRKPSAISNLKVSGQVLQRSCACGGQCPECQGELPDQENGLLQAKRVQAIHAGENVTPPIVHEVLSSSGQPLDPATRSFMEPRFGHDFSRVRVHTDSRAGDSARAVNALAYTVGQDIVFGEAQYAPNNPHGQLLLAHELTHVVQQRNVTYSTGALTLVDSEWEREADSAAESTMSGQPAQVAFLAMSGPQLARKKINTETLVAPADMTGRKVEVTRVVTAGMCGEVPDTRTSMNTEITRSHAAIELSYCRGRTRAGARGELDYSDVVRRAMGAVPNFFSSRNLQQALRNLEQSFRQAEPHANLRFDLQVGGVKARITGTGSASIEGGMSGEAGAAVGGRIGTTGVEGGVTVSGGTGEATKVGVTVKITPSAGAPEIPNCFKCTCKDPKIEFQCVVHEPGAPPKAPPPRPKQALYMPLFFEYEKAVPRAGREKDYEKALADVVERLREGYTIARIEGRTSPEGPLRKKPGFEGNISLAQRRAEKASEDLQAMLDKVIGGEEMQMRDRDALRRLKEARSASYEVKGLAAGGDAFSAELFGAVGQAEVTEREMLKHLKETLRAPMEGQPDPLVEEHVIGEGLPPEVSAEIRAEVEAFRTGKRGSKVLREREQLETIYRPLRRALIVLNPPPQEPIRLQLTQEQVEDIIGKPTDCRPEHTALFNDKPIPTDWLYEGECRPKGGVGG